MTEFKEKLVRDRIPDLVGADAPVRLASQKELWSLFKEKLLEEAKELYDAPPSTEAEELADVMEVVEALRQHVDRRAAGSLDRVRSQKANLKGVFNEGRVMLVKSS